MFLQRFPLKRTLSRLGWAACLSAVFVGGGWMARAADEAASATGLVGVLPAAAPADLEASLSQLPEDWQPWATAVLGELTKLHTEATLDSDGQKKLLAQLRKRETTAAQYLANPRFKNIAGLLQSIKGGLKRRLDVDEAVLATMEMGPKVAADRKAAALRGFSGSAATLSNNLNAISTGAGWRKYLLTAEIQTAGSNEATLMELAGKLQERIAKAPTDAATVEFLKRADIVELQKSAAALPGAGAPVNTEDLRAALTELVAALEQSELDKSSEAATRARAAYTRVKGVSPDGGERITNALRDNYFNYNVRLIAPESYLNRFISESRRDSAGISEYISDAAVSGAQTTVSNVGIDVRPSTNGALLHLTVNGTVSSSTVASTDQASVSIFGTAWFNAYKPLNFDGEKFRLGQTAVGASASSSIGNIDTAYDGGLFGGFAQRKAYSVASSRLGEGEATAVARIRGEVASRLDSEIGKEFGPKGELPTKLTQRVDALKRNKLFPSPLSWNSTNTEVRMMGRIMEANELGGSTPDASLMNPRGLTVLLHESALNNGVDRLGFAGQTLSDDEMRKKLQGHLEDLVGEKIDLGTKPVTASEENASRKLSFDQVDPIRFQAADNQLVLVIRAGIKQDGKEDIPIHAVRIPLSVTVLNEGIKITSGSIEVGTVDKSESNAVRAGVIKKKIEEAFPEQNVNRVTRFKRGNRNFTIAVTKVVTNDGWVSVWVE